MITQRLCLWCNNYQVVARYTPMATRDLCVLACGHTGVYEHDSTRPTPATHKEHQMSAHDPIDPANPSTNADGSRRVECLFCATPHTTFFRGCFADTCPACRNRYRLYCEADAKQLVDVVAATPASEVNDVLQMAEEVAQHLRPSSPRRELGPGHGGSTTAGGASSSTSAASSRAPARPPVDPVAVAAAIRSLTSYGILTPLPPTLVNPTTYAIAKNGLFEVRDTDIARIIQVPTGVVGLVDELVPGVHLKLPRVPYDFLRQTVAFFRETCKRQNGSSEAIVRVWWENPPACAACIAIGGVGAPAAPGCTDCAGTGVVGTGTYTIRVPEGGQRVSGGGVHHDDTFDRDIERLPDGRVRYIHVLDIHSHGSSMGAFWSSVDDADEVKFPEGRMAGVIGKVSQPIPEWRWRMRARTGFIDMNIADVFDMSAVTCPFTVTMDVLLKQTADPKTVDAKGGISLWVPVDPFIDATCPEEWHATVRPSHGTSYGGYGRAGGGGGGGGSSTGPAHQRGAGFTTYIYIRQPKGRTIELYEVDGPVVRATGRTFTLPAELAERE